MNKKNKQTQERRNSWKSTGGKHKPLDTEWKLDSCRNYNYRTKFDNVNFDKFLISFDNIKLI